MSHPPVASVIKTKTNTASKLSQPMGEEACWPYWRWPWPVLVMKSYGNHWSA